MMNLDKLNSWLTLAANVGVLAGISIVAIELSQTQTAMQAESSATRTQMDIENRRLGYDLDINEVAQKLIMGQEVTPDQLRGAALWQTTMLRYFENLHYQMEIGVLDEQIWEANSRGISSICSSPIFEAAVLPNWDGGSRAFRADFVELVNAPCEQ